MRQIAFDKYAEHYDAHFTGSLIGKAQRRIVQEYLKKNLDRSQSVLEINCGTGEDALFLSGLCNSLLATDISEGMVKVAREKLKGKSNVKVERLDIKELCNLSNQSFDLLFSDFGGINCLTEEEVRAFALSAFNLLNANGEILLVLMPEKCVWESFYFTLKGSAKKAFRRGNRNGVPTQINGISFNTYYYSPARIRKIFENNFHTIKVLPIGFFVPTSYLDPFFLKRKNSLALLEGFEKLSSGLSFLSGYSDHYLIHLKKKSR